jgi:hypothetical protein
LHKELFCADRQHINLRGEFDFSDEKLKNAINFSLPKILELKVT